MTKSTNKQYTLAPVLKSDLAHALPDLYYSPILTLKQPLASLVIFGTAHHIQAPVNLPSRYQGRKLYLRAATLFDEHDAQSLLQDDVTLTAVLLNAVQFRYLEKTNKKVTFFPWRIKKQTIPIPIDCLLGSCIAQRSRLTPASPRAWHILRATSLQTLYSIPSKGGIYFLRELTARTQSLQPAPKGFP